MKVNARDAVRGYVQFGKLILLLPVMSIFGAGYLGLGMFLNDLFTGNGLESIITLCWSLPIMGLFIYVCSRKKWNMLYNGGVIYSTIVLLADASTSIITKVIMVAVSVALLVFPYRQKNSPKSAAKTAGKAANNTYSSDWDNI